MFGLNMTKPIEHTIEYSGDSTVVIRLTEPNWRFETLGEIELLDPTPGQGLVIVDLSGVREMTTAGFAQLIAMKKKLAQKGWSMIVQGLQKQPSIMCRLLKLNSYVLGFAVGASLVV